MRTRLAAAALALCAGALRADDADVPKVAGWLAGTFTSPGAELPGAKGPTRLVAALVPKSRIGLGAPVLYVETASGAAPDRPYRQQFLRVEDAGPGRVALKVFEPKDRIAVSGKWREPEDLALFGERDLVERKPCHLTLTRGDGVTGPAAGAPDTRRKTMSSPPHSFFPAASKPAFAIWRVSGPITIRSVA